MTFICKKVRASAAMLLIAMLLMLLCLGLMAGTAHAAVQNDARRPGNTAEGSTPEANSKAAEQGIESEDAKYRHSAMVISMGKLMGMDAEHAATLFEVLNFALLAVGVGFVMLKTLPKTFRDRTSAIQKQLADAKAASEEASVRLNSVEDRLARLDEQIAAMRTQAEHDAALDEARIKGSIEEERKRILAAAEQEIAVASNDAQRRLQQYAAELAIEQAARKLVVTAETDRLIVQGFARRLGVEGPKGGEN